MVAVAWQAIAWRRKWRDLCAPQRLGCFPPPFSCPAAGAGCLYMSARGQGKGGGEERGERGGGGALGDMSCGAVRRSK